MYPVRDLITGGAVYRPVPPKKKRNERVMKKTTIPRKQVISDIKEMFGIPADGKRKDEGGCSFCSEKDDDTATFCIDKRHCERDEVIGRLSGYFSDKLIEGGLCRVENITFIWTQFHIGKVEKKDLP